MNSVATIRRFLAAQGWVTLFCAIPVGLLGLVVSAGWVLRSEGLIQILPGMSAMMFNTAVGLILAAAGLLDGKRATSHWMALPVLKTLGAIPVSDERVVHEGDIVTSAGVSAGIDLALWLAARIGGDDRAKAIQLSMEYDPQPPFDSGHMAKASAKTKAAATALMARDVAKPAQLKAGTLLLWDRALSAARAKVVRR